jgi:uncharacterized protein (TIGR02466 family)
MHENNTHILELFPTPVYTTMLPDSISGIIPFLDAQAMSTGSDSANYGDRSANSYVLNEDECKDVAKFILDEVEKYANDVLLYDYDSYQLSQSWVSVKHPGQHHTMHTHPNSLISGVFYYGQPSPETPAIKFHKMTGGINVSYLSPKIKSDKRPSKFAWVEYGVDFTPGLLVLFPSYLFHSVPVNKSNTVRKSVAFNIVPTGGLGQEENLTELSFKKVQ